MSGSNYQQSFFTVPFRILNLPGLTLQLLRFYEKIFQYWHRDNECFIGNEALMEHCGMKSESTVSKAFQFFEKAGEIKREIRENGQRFIIQPPRKVEIVQEKSKKLSTSPLATARVTPRASETPPLATARHNNNNLNNKNLIKSSCASRSEKPKAPKAKKPRMTRSTMKDENQWKPEWAPLVGISMGKDEEERICTTCKRPARKCGCGKEVTPFPQKLRDIVQTLSKQKSVISHH